MAVAFSVNSYDSDGDIVEKGIFLHFGDTRVKVAENLTDFDLFPYQIFRMIREIRERHPDA